MAPVSFLILARLGPRLVLNRLQRAANGGFAIAQPARGLSGKTLLGWRCGAPVLGPPSPWAPTSLLHSQRVMLTLAASYGIGRALRRVASSRHTEATPSQARFIGGSSFMIVRSRVSVSGSKLLCPAVVMK